MKDEKDKRIAELEAELKRLKEHPDYDSYLSDLTQIMFWDAEIKDNPISVKSGSEEDTRAFDKVLKYLLEKPKLRIYLEECRKRLSPDESLKAEQEATSLIDEVRMSITKSVRDK